MELSDLAGRSFGPSPFRVSAEGVADFVEVTGDDPERWANAAPPGYAAAALFAVAPDLLQRLTGRSVIHGEQTFSWHRPTAVGSELEVTGSVTRARERGGVHFVGFDLEAADPQGAVLEGSSLFLVSGEPTTDRPPAAREEPPPGYRGSAPDGWIAASRADLVRYAAVTRDWNPVHWDHDSALAAGFEGVVVHGLLQASWAFLAASHERPGTRPLSSGRVRFRNPLLPGRPVAVKVGLEGRTADVVITDEDTEYLTGRIELSDE